MQFSFSDSNAVRVIAPTASTHNGNTTAAVRKQSLYTIGETNLEQIAEAGLKQAVHSGANVLPELVQTESLTVGTIDRGQANHRRSGSTGLTDGVRSA